MKKIFFYSFFVLSFILFSCSSGHKISGVNLNGNWILNNVSFDGLPANTKFTATVFDDVPYTCLQGSVWNLPNNGNGSYTISAPGNDCSAGTRNIYWSVTSINGVANLQFKRTDNGAKPKSITEGYRMEVSDNSATSMTLRAPVDFEGKTVYIVYSFSKQ